MYKSFGQIVQNKNIFIKKVIKTIKKLQKHIVLFFYFVILKLKKEKSDH